MLTMSHPIFNQIDVLPDIDKLQLVDLILSQLDRPDPEIDRWWADEAKIRWQAYRDGRLDTVSYQEVMSKYRSL
ncbi:hypothetical protein U14_03384 [Candidatus Moduliflexus flocculans]|uniref:Addiction module protein n=1 Tax=Candidatus Moduliflexus flocculans TaxID=1499966 RepID=A0A081BP17_9BACT|nr:hypothetical protein U14_03384 [Candidatus Moduliflexus flocculans]